MAPLNDSIEVLERGRQSRTHAITSKRTSSKLAEESNGPMASEAMATIDQRRVNTKSEKFQRTQKCSFDLVPGSLPLTSISPDVDLDDAASWALSHLRDLQVSSLTQDCVWRDLYALTGLPRSIFGVDRVMVAWKDVIAIHKPGNFQLVTDAASISRLGPKHAWIVVKYTFETFGNPPAFCSGQISLIPDQSTKWRIWHFSTILEHLKGCPSPDRFPPTTDVTPHIRNPFETTDQYDCCVIGAGFSGLCASARMQALGVNYVTLETNARVGDNWRNRYDSATFHTARDYSDFPLDRMFSEKDPYFLNVKDLARGYEAYATKHHLNIATSTTLTKAQYNSVESAWDLTVTHGPHVRHIKARHIVLCVGGCGQTPVMPALPGRDKFPGIILHSAEYVNASDWKGKRGVVVGSANTGHDVAEDMLRAGLSSVTIVQRGQTDIFPAGAHTRHADHAYHRDIPLEVSDRGAMSYPHSIISRMQSVGIALYLNGMSHRYEAVEKTGFKVGLKGDLWGYLCGRQGGFYVDVGTSQKIADGLIKVKNGSVVGVNEKGLTFADDSELETDVAIFCTGFANDVREQAVRLVGPDVGELLDEYFYVDDEGEVRGAWKPHGHPGIWYHGGGVHFGRFMSRFLALQIQADCLGTPLPVYKRKT